LVRTPITVRDSTFYTRHGIILVNIIFTGFATVHIFSTTITDFMGRHSFGMLAAGTFKAIIITTTTNITFVGVGHLPILIATNTTFAETTIVATVAIATRTGSATVFSTVRTLN